MFNLKKIIRFNLDDDMFFSVLLRRTQACDHQVCTLCHHMPWNNLIAPQFGLQWSISGLCSKWSHTHTRSHADAEHIRAVPMYETDLHVHMLHDSIYQNRTQCSVLGNRSVMESLSFVIRVSCWTDIPSLVCGVKPQFYCDLTPVKFVVNCKWSNRYLHILLYCSLL